jgi:hypothetical protein
MLRCKLRRTLVAPSVDSIMFRVAIEPMRYRPSMMRMLTACWIGLCVPAGASVPTFSDCLEGSDFIANAAQARDNGMTRAAFMGRLAEDFVAIRAFPAELRWFVKDPDDERFLESAAEHVFAAPTAPSAHRSDFLRACFDRLTAQDTASARM